MEQRLSERKKAYDPIKNFACRKLEDVQDDDVDLDNFGPLGGEDQGIFCSYCKALLFRREARNSSRKLCCQKGKVNEANCPRIVVPDAMMKLFGDKSFKESSRYYNSYLAFAAPVFKSDDRFKGGQAKRGPRNIAIKGRVMHIVDPIFPSKMKTEELVLKLLKGLVLENHPFKDELHGFIKKLLKKERKMGTMLNGHVKFDLGELSKKGEEYVTEEAKMEVGAVMSDLGSQRHFVVHIRGGG
ncbi:hypothetical protein DIPPA_61142 [Diplonema papillatum]|nr:hypothetical protein DIPPA_61142 [Diplonema papillatum]